MLLPRNNPRKEQPCAHTSEHQMPPNSGNFHALAFLVFAATWRMIGSARSIPSRVTSQCVTKRTECSVVSCAQTPCGYNSSQNSTAVFPVCEQSQITMLVCTFAGSIFN